MKTLGTILFSAALLVSAPALAHDHPFGCIALAAGIDAEGGIVTGSAWHPTVRETAESAALRNCPGDHCRIIYSKCVGTPGKG